MIGRLVRSADFERVLRARVRAGSEHFALHHVADCPSVARGSQSTSCARRLSTGDGSASARVVDDVARDAGSAVVDTLWLGAVVPKRHARRSVTRSLLKRLIRAAVARHAGLARGLWVVRLRAPFDRARFASAASQALRRVARDELDSVLARATQR